MKKVFSVLMMVLGVGAFVFGSYVSNQAELGKNQVSRAEQKAQEGRKPLVGPVRKNMRAESSKSAQEKISQKEQTIAQSEVTANWLHGSGVVLFVIGLTCLVFNCSCKPRD